MTLIRCHAPKAAICSLPFTRFFVRSHDENGAEVVHINSVWTGGDQIIQSFEEVVKQRDGLRNGLPAQRDLARDARHNPADLARFASRRFQSAAAWRS